MSVNPDFHADFRLWTNLTEWTTVVVVVAAAAAAADSGTRTKRKSVIEVFVF